MTTAIERRIMMSYNGNDIVILSRSWDMLEFSPTPPYPRSRSWNNCLYLEFVKEKFPDFNYPKLVDGWIEGTKRFDYYESSFADVDFHGGITYYSEKYLPDAGFTLVRIGCDYQHLWDDHYRQADNGQKILNEDSGEAFDSFIEVYESKGGRL